MSSPTEGVSSVMRLFPFLVLCLGAILPAARPRGGAPAWAIEDIVFKGVSALPRQALLDRMAGTIPNPWCQHRFDRSVLLRDLEALRNLYRQHGYRNAAVSIDTLIRDSCLRVVTIVVDVREGNPTVVSLVSVSGNQVFADQELLPRVRARPGTKFVDSVLKRDADRLEHYMARRGHVMADVTAIRTLSAREDSAAVTFLVAEGPRVVAGDIGVRGLDGIRRGVVMRELTFGTGDTITAMKLRASRRRLMATGLFRDVSIEPEDTTVSPPPGAARQLPVQVYLQKADMFRYGVSGGFAPYEGFTLTGKVRYLNLFGLGHSIGGSAYTSTIARSANLSYRIPSLPFVPVNVALSGYASQRDEETYEGFFWGGRFSLGSVIGPDASYRLWYRAEGVGRIESPQAPGIEPPRSNESTLGFGADFNLDRRTGLEPPVLGGLAQAQVELAGLGGMGTNRFLRLWLTMRSYLPVFSLPVDIVSGVNFAYITDYGSGSEALPPQELFAIAQGPVRAVRGYDRDEIGPRNEQGKTIGGGAALVLTVAEVRFRLYRRVHGAVFADVGNVWRDIADMDLRELNWGAGPGARFAFPFALVGIDYGFRLDGSGDGRVHLTADVPLRIR